MRLPKFEYVEPRDLKEASAILNKEDGARIFAGGTDLLVNMKHRVETPALLVNLKKIPDLNFIQVNGGEVRIGALTPLKKIYNHPFIADKLPGLASAASAVGSYHHQTMGTIGGNVCQQNRCKFFNQSLQWRSSRDLCLKAGGETCHVVKNKRSCYSTYCGDTAPALLVMEARAVIESQGGSKEIALESLFSGDGKRPLSMQKGEILTQIIIPKDAVEGFSVYTKIANRESIDFPIVGASLWASPERSDFRVAYTAVDRKPLRAKKAEEALKGSKIDQQLLEKAEGLVLEEAKPVNTSVYPSAYKRKLIKTLFAAMINQVMGRSEL
ncbi:MAG: xanthine dehydrogenase family protein subunit M [Thermodesulfobacteriota bacterium]